MMEKMQKLFQDRPGSNIHVDGRRVVKKETALFRFKTLKKSEFYWQISFLIVRSQKLVLLDCSILYKVI